MTAAGEAARRPPWHWVLERLAAPVPADLYRWFRVVLAVKLFLVAVLRHGMVDPLSVALLVLLAVATANMGARRHYLPGAAVLATYSLWVVAARWPYPINHQFFEALAMCIIVLFPAQQRSDGAEGGEGWVDGLAVHLLQFAILSLFFYSAVQKVVHGYYLSGELFTLHAIYTPDFLGDRLRDVVTLVGNLVGADLEPHLWWQGGYAGAAVTAPPWALRTLVTLSWSVVVLELAAPLLVAWRRTRPVGLPLLILLQVAICASSYEVGIAFVGLNCLFLFLRRGYRIAYPLLMAAQVVFYVAVMIDPGLL